MIAVTSFSQKGYEVYGKKFLESAIKYWPTDIFVYYEDLPDLVDDKIIYKPLNDPRLYAFLSYCEKNPVFSGVTGAGYNFNYDAMRFSKKAFAQFMVLETHSGKVIWLDADIVINKKMTEDFIESVFDKQTLCAFQRPGLYTESGFLGFDTTREDFKPFLEAYLNAYKKGIIFSLPGWHDCYAVDYAIAKSGVSVKNLSPDYPKNGINVIPHSEIGTYLVHNKGKRKYEKGKKNTG